MDVHLHTIGGPPAVDVERLRCKAARSSSGARLVALLELLCADLGSASLSELGAIGIEIELDHALDVLLACEVAVPDPPPISRPVIVGGLPRTGTTYLHRLLLACTGGAAPLGWEAHTPTARREGSCSAAIVEATARFDAAADLSPRLDRLHHLDALEPEECTPLLQHSLQCLQWGLMLHAPTYVDSLLDDPVDHAYREWARQLTAIDDSQMYWVLKSPMHLYGYADLARAAPGAHVVQVRRRAVDALRSFLNLALEARRIFSDNVDPGAMGPFWLRRYERILGLATDGMGSLDTPTVIVDYPDLVAEPRRTTESIARRVGLDIRPGWSDDVGAAGDYVSLPLKAFGLDERKVEHALRDHLDGPFLLP